MAKKKVIIIPWEDTAKWLCTFNDLMTLLLTFFVLILSMSSLDAKKVKDFQQAILDGLGLMEAGQGYEETIIDKLFDIKEIGKKLKVFKNLLPGSKDETKVNDLLMADDRPDIQMKDFYVIKEEGRDQLYKKEMEHVFNQFKEVIDESFFQPGITVIKEKRGSVLRLKDNVLFNPGMAEIKDEKNPLLAKVASVLKETHLYAYVEGHTDSTPIHTSTYPSNWELSVARSVSVVEYLVNNYSAAPEKFRVTGYGATMPIVPNNTPNNRSKNRRIDIIISRS
jgi:chemotaxis protein MotB